MQKVRYCLLTKQYRSVCGIASVGIYMLIHWSNTTFTHNTWKP